MRETPRLCKRGIWIMSIQESSEERKDKTSSADHRNLPRKKEGSNAVMKAKKKKKKVEFALWDEICIAGTSKQLMQLCRELRYLV